MFERFTEDARQVVVLAQDEARALNHNYIGTEHLLLGLLRDPSTLACHALNRLGVAIGDVRKRVAEVVGTGEEEVAGQIPFTARAKKTLELSLRTAHSWGHNYIGPEHIAVALVGLPDGVAAEILADLGVDTKAVEGEIAAHVRPGRTEWQHAQTDDKRGERRRRRRARRLGRSRYLPMPRWSYRTEHGIDAERLDELGADGWELVAIVRGQAILKKQAG